MVKCCNCEHSWMSDDDLTLLIEHENGKISLYTGEAVADGCEVFRGCPFCMTDGHLMDVDD